MKFKEVEFKYKLPGLKLSQFKALADSMKPRRYIETAGYDYYFTNQAATDFIRYRAGDRQELTTKRKTEEKNNYVRDEFNLLIAHGQPLHVTAGFCRSLGFPRLNFSIYKACFIYYYEKFDLVYYVVYDEDLQEKDRFVEIEMLEDYPWASEDEAWKALLELEKSCESLGINATIRQSKSLFEMYRKD